MKFLSVTLIAGALLIPMTGPAMAATATDPGVVIAEDARGALTAAPSAPGTITVTTAPGTRVSVMQRARTKSSKIREATADTRGVVKFAKLTSGAVYTVLTPRATTTVTPVTRVAAADALKVTTTESANRVILTWNHRRTAAQGAVRYRVEALGGENTPTITDIVTTTSASLTGLDPRVRYTFRVTPVNALGDGTPTVARMHRSLGEVAGLTVPVVVEPSTPAPVRQSTPQPEVQRPASEPAPAPAPGPRTRTIYVCPDGFAESGDLCTQTRAYTFHAEKQTTPYTYRDVFVETNRIWHDDPFDPFTGCRYTVHGDRCMGWETQGYTTKVKNNPPAGYTDNGTAYETTVQVKDALPAGYSDNGSAWVKSAAKVAREVPA